MINLPNGWKVKTLGEVAVWGSGGTPQAGNPEYYGGSIPWAIIGDLNDGVVYSTEKSITEDGLANSSAKLVPTGAILIAMYGSIGKMGIAGVPMATNQAIAFALPNQDLILPSYLFWFLSSQRELFLSQGKGATQQNISQTLLKAWQVPVPPLDEQRRIIETLEDHLSRLDKALAETKAALHKTQTFTKSFLLSIVDGESPLIAGTEKWSRRTIGSLGKWRGGGTPSKRNPAYWLDGEIPWLTAKDMKQFRIADTQDHITELGVSGSSANLLPEGAVVVVTRSGILEWKLPVALTEAPMTINQDLKALVCSSDVNPEWAAYSILGFEHRILDECRKAGTTVANLNFDDFLKFQINLPALQEQATLVALLKNQLDYLDSIQVRVNQIVRSLGTSRRSLLRSAFSGELVKVR
jgi:type I restriction enzyme S subunit